MLSPELLSKATPEQLARIKALCPVSLLDLVPPNSDPQRDFISTEADIAIIGGSAGGAKSWALLLEASQDFDKNGFVAVYFRRTFKMVMDESGPWTVARKLLPKLGATPNISRARWTMPSGAVIQYAGLENENDVLDWQSAQIACIIFDELTHFLSSQFWYLLSRNRSPAGHRCRIRAGTNPDICWVRELIAPWIDDKFPTPADSGELRWFVRENEQIVWLDEKPHREICTNGEDGGKCFKEGCHNCFPPEMSIAFIRSSVYNNPDLLKNDPRYITRLLSLDDVDKRRLHDGDWNAMPANLVLDGFLPSRNQISGDPRLRVTDEEFWRNVGMDFGSHNTAGIAIAQSKHNPKQLIVYGEDWPGRNRGWDVISADMKRIAGGWIKQGHGGNRTGEQGWREAMSLHGIPLDEPDKDFVDPKLQYKVVNDALLCGDLLIMGHCEKTISMITRFQRKIDPKTGVITDDFDDSPFHLLAALRYIVIALRKPEILSVSGSQVIRQAPKPVNQDGKILEQQNRPWDLTGRSGRR